MWGTDKENLSRVFNVHSFIFVDFFSVTAKLVLDFNLCVGFLDDEWEKPSLKYVGSCYFVRLIKL